MFLSGTALVSGSCPPASSSAVPPMPSSPWQLAHLLANSGAPCARPVPSGKTFNCQAAMSAAVAGLPRCGPSFSPVHAAPPATLRVTAAASAAHRSNARDPSRIDIMEPAVLANLPGDDGVVVEIAVAAALGDQRRALRLHVAGVVGGAALQDRGPAVPMPAHAEAGEAAR